VQATGARSVLAYALPGAAVWIGLYLAGVHPTLAGVLLGLATPVRTWLGTSGLADARARLGRIVDEHTDDMHGELARVEQACREAVSPSAYLEHRLHGLVAYGIMPVFALANAGVALGGASFDGAGASVFWGIVLGLVVGKTGGIVFACWLSTRLGVARAPRGVGGRGFLVVASVAGIGFTMSLFIAQLAFPPGPLLETAKLGILVGSGAAMVLGAGLGIWLLRGTAVDCAPDETAAERATDE